MPFVPYPEWEDGTLVSPTNLHTNLYSWLNASPLYPTGVQFHGRRPIYKGVANGTVSVASGTWQFPFHGQGDANPVADSCGDYGVPMDPAQWGAIQSNLPGADGQSLIENPTPGGGWFLLTAFIPIGPASANGTTFEADISEAGANTTYGQNVLATDNGTGTPWTVDLFDMTGDVWTPYVYNGDADTMPTLATANGSGNSVYFTAIWASILAAAGQLPGLGDYPPAPKTNWAGGDQWTSAWANSGAGLGGVLRTLNQPPCLRADSGASAATALANETETIIELPNATLDTWSGWNDSTYTYTVPIDGIYFCYGLVTYNTATMSMQTAIQINGVAYFGPSNVCRGVQNGTSAKAQVFSLLAGDTVKLVGWQSSGGTIDTHVTQKPRLVIVWLGSPGSTGALAANGYFAQGSGTDWAATGGVLSTQDQVAGGSPYPWNALLTPSGAGTTAAALNRGAPFAVTPSLYYAMSAWVNPDGTVSAVYGFDWLNSSGGTIATTAASQTVTGTPTSAWTLVHTIQQAPGSATAGYIRTGMTSSGTIASSLTLGIAGAQAGALGAGGQPTPPDLTYRYTAGTAPDQVAPIFTGHLGNDLSFLIWRPYLLAYQSTDQTVANATQTQVDMNVTEGIVHGDWGDTYNGWSPDSWYVAPVDGWYLVVAEVSVTTQNGASFPNIEIRLVCSNAPGTFDAYERHVVTAVAADGTVPGATAVGLYHLNAGEYIYPAVIIEGYTATQDTVVTTGHQSHFECVYISS